MDINIITVSGTVDKAPTSAKHADVLYVNFSLAVNGNNTLVKPWYYTISASGKNAESILNNVNVGDKLFIVGRPSVDTYMAKDKQIIAIQKVWIEKFEFCGSSDVGAVNIAVEDSVADESMSEGDKQNTESNYETEDVKRDHIF